MNLELPKFILSNYQDDVKGFNVGADLLNYDSLSCSLMFEMIWKKKIDSIISNENHQYYQWTSNQESAQFLSWDECEKSYNNDIDFKIFRLKCLFPDMCSTLELNFVPNLLKNHFFRLMLPNSTDREQLENLVKDEKFMANVEFLKQMDKVKNQTVLYLPLTPNNNVSFSTNGYLFIDDIVSKHKSIDLDFGRQFENLSSIFVKLFGQDVIEYTIFDVAMDEILCDFAKLNRYGKNIDKIGIALYDSMVNKYSFVSATIGTQLKNAYIKSRRQLGLPLSRFEIYFLFQTVCQSQTPTDIFCTNDTVSQIVIEAHKRINTLWQNHLKHVNGSIYRVSQQLLTRVIGLNIATSYFDSSESKVSSLSLILNGEKICLHNSYGQKSLCRAVIRLALTPLGKRKKTQKLNYENNEEEIPSSIFIVSEAKVNGPVLKLLAENYTGFGTFMKIRKDIIGKVFKYQTKLKTVPQVSLDVHFKNNFYKNFPYLLECGDNDGDLRKPVQFFADDRFYLISMKKGNDIPQLIPLAQDMPKLERTMTSC